MKTTIFILATTQTQNYIVATTTDLLAFTIILPFFKSVVLLYLSSKLLIKKYRGEVKAGLQYDTTMLTQLFIH